MFEPRVPDFLHIQTLLSVPSRRAPSRARRRARRRRGELEEAILREGPDTVAAFIAEPIHGGGGVIVPADDYFPLVREVCDKHNVLFIADEVITGFCRTGKWFALDALERAARHHVVRQGRDLRLSRRSAASWCRRPSSEAMDDGEARGPLDARLHLLGAPHVLRGRPQEHRDHGARAAVGARGPAGDAPPPGAARAPEGAAGHRRRARAARA